MALTDNGYIRPTYNDILNEKIKKAKELFGFDIDTSEQTALGKFIRIGAYDLESAYKDAEKIYYSAFLNYASGVSLDRACVFSGVTRTPPKHASANVTLQGTAGYAVPFDFKVRTESGIVFYNSKETVIKDDGTCELTVICKLPGVIGNVEANDITQIVEPDANIAKIVSSTAGTGGTEQESDYDLRKRALSSIEGAGSANVNAIRAAVMRVNNVKSVGIIENRTKDTVDGRPPNSFECFVYGNGAKADEVAQAIFEKTPIGILTCSTSSEPQHETIIDDSGTERDVYFSFVEGVDLSFKVTVKTNAKFESDGVDQIKKSLEDYINGLGVGKWVYHSALYGCVYGVTGVENVESITISVDGAAYTTDDVEIDATSVAQTSKSKIEVTKDV